MPEPDTDKFRESPTMSTGLKKPRNTEIGVPIRPYIRTTDDEAYQFRYPDYAYMRRDVVHELPDGLQTDGTQPRKWGENIPAEQESADNGKPNPKG